MEIGIAGYDCAAIRPGSGGGCQLGADGVLQDVIAGRGEGSSAAFFLAQDVVVGLMLPFSTFAQNRLQSGAEEFHGV